MQEQKFKKEVVLSKMPLDECSAAMGFEVEKLSGNAAL